MKPFAAPRACKGWKAKRCICIIFFRTFVLRITLILSRIFTEPLTSVSNEHNCKTFSEWPPAFPPYFFLNQLERQATICDILINRTRTFAWKEPLPVAPPLGKLDNNLSPRVGDFAQKIIPDLSCPGGTLGDTLDTSITLTVRCLQCCNASHKSVHNIQGKFKIYVGYGSNFFLRYLINTMPNFHLTVINFVSFQRKIDVNYDKKIGILPKSPSCLKCNVNSICLELFSSSITSGGSIVVVSLAWDVMWSVSDSNPGNDDPFLDKSISRLLFRFFKSVIFLKFLSQILSVIFLKFLPQILSYNPGYGQ